MKKVLIGLVVVLLAVGGFIATRPAEFRIERSAVVEAPAELVLAQVADFHTWKGWSPWEKLDPTMKVEFAGAEKGVGAKYSWVSPKDEVGEGRMEVTAVTADKVTIALEFIKPFPAKNTIEFSASGSKVTWAMSGQNNFMMKAMSLVKDMDAMVGPDFERGLASLKTVAEAEAKKVEEAKVAAAAAAATPAEAPTVVAAPATP